MNEKPLIRRFSSVSVVANFATTELSSSPLRALFIWFPVVFIFLSNSLVVACLTFILIFYINNELSS